MPVDLATLLEENPLGGNVAIDLGAGLDLHALISIDSPPHFSTNDGFASQDITLDYATFSNENLSFGPYAPRYHSLHLHYTVGVQPAINAHSGGNNRKSRLPSG